MILKLSSFGNPFEYLPGTANPKQNVCPGETQIRLRSLSSLINVFAEEVMGSWLAYSGWQGFCQDTEVLTDLSFCWAYIFLCWPAARAPQPMPRSPCPASPQFSHSLFLQREKLKTWYGRQNKYIDPCAWWRLRSTWTPAQVVQSLRCPYEEALGLQLPINHTAKTLIRLGGCIGWSEFA